MALAARERDRHGASAAPPLGREITIGLLVFAIYVLVSGLEWSGRRATANVYSRQIFDLERALGIDVEPTLNHWLVHQHQLVRTLANYEYATTYVISAFGVLFWLYLRRPDAYPRARTSFILINLIGVSCFALYPVTPPRLMPDLGFVDTVRLGRTWGSWGTPVVEHANQLGAMPSLHIAWALWVSAVLAMISASRLAQTASAAHILVTTLVIMVTANHYLLDAVGGALLVALCMRLTRPPRESGRRVPAADAFFVHAESAAAPQHVGGLVLLEATDPDTFRDKVQAVVEDRLEGLPRFRQRLSAPSRWRRARWVAHPQLDLAWHVPQRDLTRPDGRPGDEAALHALVAEVAGTPLPRDRPLWRVIVVPRVGEDRAAVIFIVHHVISDGIGTVAQALRLLDPALPAREFDQRTRPGLVRTALGTAAGLAQLATDGQASYRLPSSRTAQRRFATVSVRLDQVRTVARRHGSRVSDVVLCAVAGGLHRARPDLDGTAPLLRVAVPLMVREPGASAEGNITAAVMTDLPLGPMPEAERLAGVAARSRRLHTGTRALASRFVMKSVGDLLPVPAHAWFARTVYGGRFFQAIVSNMPGPEIQLSLAGVPLIAAYPILPLAPHAPLAVGALGWNGWLRMSIATDPALADDIEALAVGIKATIGELLASGRIGPPPAAGAGARATRPAGR